MVCYSVRNCSIHAWVTVIEACQASGLTVRFEGDSAYEVNASGPHLYAQLRPDAERNPVGLAAAITGFASQVAYFYLPFLLGAVPERDVRVGNGGGDPRLVNRSALPFETHSPSARSDELSGVLELLRVLGDVHRELPMAPRANRANVRLCDGPLLDLEGVSSLHRLIVNFGYGERAVPTDLVGRTPTLSSSISSSSLSPLSYALYVS